MSKIQCGCVECRHAAGVSEPVHMPNLERAIKRVFEIHYDDGPGMGYLGGGAGYGRISHGCAACGSHGEFTIRYPCETVRAFIDAGIEVVPDVPEPPDDEPDVEDQTQYENDGTPTNE